MGRGGPRCPAREHADTRDRPLTDSRQGARTVTTTGNSITKGMTPAEEFAEHGESKAGPAGGRQARAETAGLTARQAGAGITPERPEENHEETAAHLLNH